MKVAYPAGNQLQTLSDSLLCLKISRHAPCTICDNCSGLHPPKGVRVVLDEPDESSLGDLEQYGSDDEEVASSYLELCACGHDTKQHNANATEIGRREFIRRSQVGIRLDELLQDSGRLLDFEYTDEDIMSLRKQMIIPVRRESPAISLVNSSPDHRRHSVPLSSPTTSSLSDPEPPTKKRRASTSSLSDAEENEDDDDDDDDEEEDKPLASRMGGASTSRSVPGKRAGKLPGGGKKAKKSHTAPDGEHRTNGKSNGTNGHAKVKLEEKMDEGQLSRLAAGVPMDTGSRAAPTQPTVKTEKISAVELRRGVIQFSPVENDGNPRSLVILTGLKTLFQKQLPKMPREYIARLVYDDNSKSLAIIKRGYKVVGGICYRPFPHRGFAEIVFFATNSADQEKGYGGALMDHFKMHIRKTYPDMMHFLTYADNYAVGYFEKQGFSKEITLEKSVWAGYIKDYEGGTIMQCTLIPKVDYLDKKKIFSAQQEAILTKIRQLSKSHIIHPGLPQFQPGQPANVTVDPKEVPGLRETGWSPDLEKDILRLNLRSPDYNLMEKTLHSLRENSHSWPFREPVAIVDVPDYLDVIKTPMDLLTMEHKLTNNQYKNVEQFVDDALLVFDNCRLYNPESSIYHKNAIRMEKQLKELLPSYVRRD